MSTVIGLTMQVQIREYVWNGPTICNSEGLVLSSRCYAVPNCDAASIYDEFSSFSTNFCDVLLFLNYTESELSQNVFIIPPADFI
jgi:hypothetical protein